MVANKCLDTPGKKTAVKWLYQQFHTQLFFDIHICIQFYLTLGGSTFHGSNLFIAALRMNNIAE